MSYLTLYRKYRPKSFEEVSGQKVPITILKNAIKNDKISHAYLFAGPRGTGKTSIAKILSRTINCDQHGTEPCEKCPSCINSNSKECVDIIEIDAASNNGVDEIRELKSKINIVPSYLKYKVYIIDEVHMLSTGAFNALLKTLEEPPSHVIFILATTEVQKIPATILSRCQILEFKKIPNVDMKKRLTDICNFENIKIDEQAIDEIISLSDGCLRDALSLLEKAISFSDGDITEEDIRNMCGKIANKEIADFIDLVVNKKSDELIKKINELYYADYDMLYFAEDLINQLEYKIFEEKQNQNIFSNILSMFIDIYDKMKTTSVNKKIILEIELLKNIEQNDENISREIFLKQTFDKENNVIKNNDSQDENINTSKKTEEKIVNEPLKTLDYNDFKKVRMNNAFYEASKDILNELKNDWNKLKDNAFDKTNGSYICNLLDGLPVVANNDYIALAFPYESMANNINEEYITIEKILVQYLNQKKHVVAISNEEWKQYRSEYINKLNNGLKYEIINDTYINVEKNNNITEPKIKKDDSALGIEKKALELFDSDIIEIE